MPANRVEIRAGVIRRATTKEPPPHPSIIRNPIKEFCEQMAISHRETREGDEVGGNGGEEGRTKMIKRAQGSMNERKQRGRKA